MNQFFTLEFSGGPFRLFSPSHLVALGFFVLLNIFFFIRRKSFSAHTRTIICYVMAAALIINECLWHIWNLTTGQWNIQTMLPLHLCSVLVWLSAYMLVKKSEGIYEFAFLLGIPGALQALLTPDLGIYDFPHFRYFQVFVSHGLIITSALYMTFVEGHRPYPRSILRIAIVGNIYLAAVTAINFAIGGNYLFTAHKPVTASVLDILPAWPYYIPLMELLAFICIALLYIPFWVKDFRQKRAVIEPL